MGISNTNWRSFYLFFACLIALIVFIISSIFTIRHVMDIVFDNSYYEDYQNFKIRYTKTEMNNNKSEYSINENKLKEAYEEYIKLEKKRNRNRVTVELLTSIYAMVIALVVWIFHWRKIQKGKQII